MKIEMAMQVSLTIVSIQINPKMIPMMMILNPLHQMKVIRNHQLIKVSHKMIMMNKTINNITY